LIGLSHRRILDHTTATQSARLPGLIGQSYVGEVARHLTAEMLTRIFHHVVD
jgi:hypothetical protein